MGKVKRVSSSSINGESVLDLSFPQNLTAVSSLNSSLPWNIPTLEKVENLFDGLDSNLESELKVFERLKEILNHKIHFSYNLQKAGIWVKLFVC